MLVACLLVMGEMLDRTGVAAAIGDWILTKGGSEETRLYIVIMVAAALLGAVMSSTAVVAIFIPIILRIARETGIRASGLLMPMAYAALISGMLTLIATTPNIVISEELRDSGFSEFGFFTFTPVGLAVLAVSIVYILTIGRRLIPMRDGDGEGASAARAVIELWGDYRVDRGLLSCSVATDSPLSGQSLSKLELQSRFGVRIIGIQRDRALEYTLPPPDPVLKSGDILILIGTNDQFETFCQEMSAAPRSIDGRERQRWFWELGASTVMVHPESPQIGQSVISARFMERHHIYVMGLRRDGEAVKDFEDMPLQASDCLFVIGRWKHIERMCSKHHDVVALEAAAELDQIVPEYRRMPMALGIFAAMVLLSVLNILPLVVVVMMTALAAVVFRCMTMEDAYRSIHWSSLVLVAGMLPLADALDQTGGTALIVEALMDGVGDAGPGVMLTVLFFLTASIGLFLSNTASAVLVAPIAITAAESLGVSPYPFAVAVLIAASAAFVTPVSTPVVTLVVEPGRYHFMDFVKVGRTAFVAHMADDPTAGASVVPL